MPIYTIDESQRKAAKVAGIAYLITFATGVYVNFGIHDRLIVANNAAETAQLSEIRRPGEVAYPYECCGVLTGEMLAGGSKRVLGVARCSNTHTTFREAGLKLILASWSLFSAKPVSAAKTLSASIIRIPMMPHDGRAATSRKHIGPVALT